MERSHASERPREDDLKRLIDADESLSAHYRATLFPQQHEAQLISPGKTSEVTNVVLSFHVIAK